MMGDNRDHSNDSRFWGSVPYGLIEGTPWFVYFSMDSNYEVRWDRIGKTPSDLEHKDDTRTCRSGTYP
jgi:signal peptidase I